MAQIIKLQVMWFADAHTVSDGVKCYPTPFLINTYNVFSPIKDLTVNLLVPSIGRVVIAGYQLPIYSSSSRWFTTRMHKNNQQLLSTIMSQGDDRYYNLNSLWMDYQNDADYEFGVTYHNAYSAYFEDCQNNYQGNKNLYAMYLPSACRKLVTSLSTSSLSLSTTDWKTIDLSSTFTLYQDEHIFVRYQFSTSNNYGYSYVFTRLVIDSVPIKHTASISGDNCFTGNSGMWQGVLSSGRHTIAVQQRSSSTYTHYTANDDSNPYYTRAMDIIRSN